jgi:hypothetical protein
MKIPVFIQNKWITWMTDLQDVSVRSLQVGALVYARSILDGMSEKLSHQMAEKAVFEAYYRVKY